MTGGACAPVRPTHPSSALQSTGRQAVKTEGNPVRLVRADLRPHQSNQKTALSRIGRARCCSSKATPAEYKAGLDLAVARGWLVLHENGTYVRFTQAGAELFA